MRATFTVHVFVQKVLHSAVFFAVQCKQMDMLDLLLRNDRIDLSIRDIVSINFMQRIENNLLCCVVGGQHGHGFRGEAQP